MSDLRLKKRYSGFFCAALIAAVLLSTTGCSSKTEASASGENRVYSVSDTPYVLGEGELTFEFSVIDLEGEEVRFEISSNEDTVGEALTEVGLITGEEGPYGLMVTAVNGERLVYEEDKAYWAFYVDGEYALAGVDETTIEPGRSYSFQATQV